MYLFGDDWSKQKECVSFSGLFLPIIAFQYGNKPAVKPDVRGLNKRTVPPIVLFHDVEAAAQDDSDIRQGISAVKDRLRLLIVAPLCW